MKKQKAMLEKGITLVALIITIIVMLILVAVTVTIVVDSDIIGQAEQAGNVYKDAYTNEGNKVSDETIEGEGLRHNTVEGYLQDICKHNNLDENLKCTNCKIQLIEFAIEGTLYYAKEGMTWYDWCSSQFNTVGWSCLPNSSVSMFDEYGGRSIVLRGRYEDSSDYVQGSETIVANKDYNRIYEGPMVWD